MQGRICMSLWNVFMHIWNYLECKPKSHLSNLQYLYVIYKSYVLESLKLSLSGKMRDGNKLRLHYGFALGKLPAVSVAYINNKEYTQAVKIANESAGAFVRIKGTPGCVDKVWNQTRKRLRAPVNWMLVSESSRTTLRTAPVKLQNGGNNVRHLSVWSL